MSDETSKGIWAAHFHWRVLLKWDVLGWIVGILLAIAAILLVFDQYPGVNLCFIIVATLFAAKVTHVAVIAVDPIWQRVLFTFLLFGLIGVGVVEAVRGVILWQASHEKPNAVDNSVIPEVDKSLISLNCEIVNLPVSYKTEIWFSTDFSQGLGKTDDKPS